MSSAPRSRARPTIPSASAASTIAGKIVIRSAIIDAVTSRRHRGLPRRVRLHQPFRRDRSRSARRPHPRAGRSRATNGTSTSPCSRRDHQQRRPGKQHMVHPADHARPSCVSTRKPREVVHVVRAGLERLQRVGRNPQFQPAQRLGLVDGVDALETDDPPALSCSRLSITVSVCDLRHHAATCSARPAETAARRNPSRARPRLRRDSPAAAQCGRRGSWRPRQ